MTKLQEKKYREKRIAYFNVMKNSLLKDIETGRHMLAFCAGTNIPNKDFPILKEWLESEGIVYNKSELE